MAIYICIFIVLLIPVIIQLKLGSGIRRGCGRGCATCGNKEFCHRKTPEKKLDKEKSDKEL